jgi:hypothetical protein
MGPRGFTGDTGPAGKDGLDGAKGDPGEDGVGIKAITLFKDGGPGEFDVYNIHLTDGRIYNFSVYNGSDGKPGDKGERGERGPEGKQGEKGEKGEKGDKGDQGLSLSMKQSLEDCSQINDCYLDSDGYLQVITDINNEGLLIFTRVGRIVGPQGSQGPQGEQGPQGVKGETGETGATGPKGDQGVGIESITHAGNTTGVAGTMDTYFINLSNGDSYPIVLSNGSDGNHIIFGNGEPENITDINSNLEYIFNPCGYIEEEDIPKIIGNKGDVYINLLDGSVFEYTSE